MFTNNPWCRPALILAGLMAVVPAMADTQFRVRRMTRHDVPLGKGQCDIRLQVDDEVEVSVRGDSVYVRTISGRDARDDGSECNEPLPARNLEGFNYEVRDRRGEIQLLSEPSRRNEYRAIVRIRDSAPGEGRYHFRLTWRMTGDSGGRDADDGSRPDRIRGDKDWDGGPGGRFRWNDRIDFRADGRGAYDRIGYGSQRLYEANVNIDRSGRVLVFFYDDSDRRISFSGNVTGADRDLLNADVVGDQRPNLRGSMTIEFDNRRDVSRISMSGTEGRDRFRLSWTRR